MVLDSLLTGVMLFGSFAIRDANVQPNPNDYEVSIGISHESYYINRQWERELGSKYLDDQVWFKIDKFLYIKPEYFNKQSDNVKYAKVDWRKGWKDISFGFTTRSTTDKLNAYETFISVGTSKKKTYWDKVDVEVSFDGYLPPNSDFEFEDKFKVSYRLTEKLRLYNVGEVTHIKGESNYKTKIGLEYTL